MRKKQSLRLQLHRETLRTLETSRMGEVAGASEDPCPWQDEAPPTQGLPCDTYIPTGAIACTSG